jgi:hypothetical protein
VVSSFEVLEQTFCMYFLFRAEFPARFMFLLIFLAIIGDSKSQGSSVSIVSDYGLDDWGSIPERGMRIFSLASASRPALGPTQPPLQWVPRVLSPGVKRSRGVMLTIHPHLVPRLRMSRSYTSSHPKRLHGV